MTNENTDYRREYINLLETHISTIVYAFDEVDDGVLTLKEDLEHDVKKNPSDVLIAIGNVIDNVEKPNITDKFVVKSYELVLNQLMDFERYVNLKDD